MSRGGTSHSLVARLYTQCHWEPWVRVSSRVRLAQWPMPSEGIQGHELGTYVALETFLDDGTRDGLKDASPKVTESGE